MLHILSILLIAIAAAPTGIYGNTTSAIGKQYKGYQILRFSVTSLNQLSSLRMIIATFKETYPWTKMKLGDVDVATPPNEAIRFKASAASAALAYDVLVVDLQAKINKQSEFSRSLSPDANVFADYRDAATYVTHLLKFPGTHSVSIGKTYLGKDIMGVKFGTGKDHIVIHGGIHAREWIGPAVATYFGDFLNGGSAVAATLCAAFTFTIIPVLNLDGYEYTRDPQGDRLWRKNRQPNENSDCVGTDPNRNFPYSWGEAGASSDPCDENYYGPSVMSAPETAAVYNYVKTTPNVISYMDFHSYSQLFMFPFGSDCNAKADGFESLMRGSQLAVDALKSVHGTQFQSGPICSTIYQASGSSVDTMYSLGVRYPYTAELRDTGNHGFLLPASQIRPSGDEMVQALSALYTYIASLKNKSS